MKKIKIGVIGLGYVGLPVAIAFQKNIKSLALILIQKELMN